VVVVGLKAGERRDDIVATRIIAFEEVVGSLIEIELLGAEIACDLGV